MKAFLRGLNIVDNTKILLHSNFISIFCTSKFEFPNECEITFLSDNTISTIENQGFEKENVLGIFKYKDLTLIGYGRKNAYGIWFNCQFLFNRSVLFAHEKSNNNSLEYLYVNEDDQRFMFISSFIIPKNLPFIVRKNHKEEADDLAEQFDFII